MGLWPLPFKSYGPFLKSMGHGSYGMGQKLKKRNIGILVRDVTFDSVYHTASCSWHENEIVLFRFYFNQSNSTAVHFR